MAAKKSLTSKEANAAREKRIMDARSGKKSTTPSSSAKSSGKKGLTIKGKK